MTTIDANTATSANDAFTWATDAFTGAGQLHYNAATHILYGNTDADSAAEFAIQLTGVNSLAATDVLL